jgi:hypothetical protein
MVIDLVIEKGNPRSWPLAHALPQLRLPRMRVRRGRTPRSPRDRPRPRNRDEPRAQTLLHVATDAPSRVDAMVIFDSRIKTALSDSHWKWPFVFVPCRPATPDKHEQRGDFLRFCFANSSLGMSDRG